MNYYEEDEDEDLNEAYYDDGSFDDSAEEERSDSFYIPTYDELDLEGRYYNYGSREDYNEWRNEQYRLYLQNDK